VPDQKPSRDEEKSKAELVRELKAQRKRLEQAEARSKGKPAHKSASPEKAALKTVSVPEPFAPIFLNAQQYVRRYFESRVEDPEHSTISISGERYILVRAASMSVEFFELVRSLYQDKGAEEARSVANNLLFDLAHAIGKADARTFHARMGVTDPIEKLSAGPIHFSFSGWAFVKIFPESQPSPNEHYYLIYDHPFSFESDAWLKRTHGVHTDFPVCIMNAGYSSGWCEESFGLRLVAAEVECLAKGDAQCRFIMAPPTRIEEHLERYFREKKTLGRSRRAHERPMEVNIPEFFQRKRMEEELRRSHDELEQRVLERTTEVLRANKQLREEVERRVHAQEALERSNERFEVASSAANTVIYESELGVDRITWTRGMTEVLGYPLAEVPNTRAWWMEHIHPDDRPRTLMELQQALNDQADFFLEYRFREHGGRYVNVWDKGRVVRDGHGLPVRLIGALVDITERKRLEDQLRQAQKMEAIGRLAGGVAHDFNNLLTVIQGYSELLARDVGNPERAAAHIEEIKKGANRAASLTRQLLAFSRRQVLAPEVLDLYAVVAHMGNMLDRILGADIDLKILPSEQPHRVRADRGQIEQVVMNLAVNARDAMPHGGALELECSSIELDADYARGAVKIVPGRYAMLNVRDTGVGMDAETMAHVFEPFFTTKEAGRGTGLGLATVYGIVKQSGGYVWVSSEPGAGTTFTIQLPEVTEQMAEKLEKSSTAAVSSGGSEKVLLVEDEAPVRKLVHQVLRDAGYSVQQAASGPEALKLAASQTEPIELLITDVVMPQMSGRELAQELTKRFPQLKVLFVSGYTGDAVMERGMLDPGAAFLQKPFNSEALLRKVQEILQASGARRR